MEYRPCKDCNNSDPSTMFSSEEEEIAFFREAGRALGLDYTTFPAIEPRAGGPWTPYERIKFLVCLLPNLETIYWGAWPFYDVTGWDLDHVAPALNDLLVWYRHDFENSNDIRSHCQLAGVACWPHETPPMTPPLLQRLTKFRASSWDTRMGQEDFGGLTWRFLLPAFFLPNMRSIWGHMITPRQIHVTPHTATVSHLFPEHNVESYYGASPVTSIELSSAGCFPISHLIRLPKKLKVLKYHYTVWESSHERLALGEIAAALPQLKNHLEVLHLDNYMDHPLQGQNGAIQPYLPATPQGQTGGRLRTLERLHEFPVLRELNVDYWMLMGDEHARNPAEPLVSKLPPNLETLHLEVAKLMSCVDCRLVLCRERIRDLAEVLERKKELFPKLALLELGCLCPNLSLNTLPQEYLDRLEGTLEPLAVAAGVELRYSPSRKRIGWGYIFAS
ncbi:hypothetical protein EV426DRAFT_599436 [Tirmania nivea]|nr:hypothetical protein EV426DRAFT_599436 [Tirmania nivea]